MGHFVLPQRIFLALMPSINKKCHQSHFLGGVEITGGKLHPAFGVNFKYISKCKILHKIFLKTVVKTCENDSSNTIFVAKVKVSGLHKYLKSHETKQLLTSIAVDIRIYLPSKVMRPW